MAKRFSDSDKFKKDFYRGLPAPYKLLWDFICHDCDHAGIWHVDNEIAQIYIGKDAPIDIKKAFDYFNTGEQRVVPIDGGKKWFIRPFIEFQYGNLNPDNRVHASILSVIEKYKIRGLQGPYKGAMDMDMDMDMDKENNKKPKFEDFWKAYPKKKSKGQAEKTWKKIKPNATLFSEMLVGIEKAKKSPGWTKDNGEYIPYPSSWLNAKGWEDEATEVERRIEITTEEGNTEELSFSEFKEKYPEKYRAYMKAKGYDPDA